MSSRFPKTLQATLALLSLIVSVLGCKRHEYSTGEAAFQGECAKCHKLDGQGGTKGPDLTNIFLKKDENFVRSYTQDPRSIKPDGTMPPSKLSDHEMDLLIAYIKERGKPQTK